MHLTPAIASEQTHKVKKNTECNELETNGKDQKKHKEINKFKGLISAPIGCFLDAVTYFLKNIMQNSPEIKDNDTLVSAGIEGNLIINKLVASELKSQLKSKGYEKLWDVCKMSFLNEMWVPFFEHTPGDPEHGATITLPDYYSSQPSIPPIYWDIYINSDDQNIFCTIKHNNKVRKKYKFTIIKP
jgi:hypothetical protein